MLKNFTFFFSLRAVCITPLVFCWYLYWFASSTVLFRALGVPITDYSFEDCQLAMAEGQLRLPVDTCLLEYAKLVRRLGWVSGPFPRFPGALVKESKEGKESVRWNKRKGRHLARENRGNWIFFLTVAIAASWCCLKIYSNIIIL